MEGWREGGGRLERDSRCEGERDGAGEARGAKHAKMIWLCTGRWCVGDFYLDILSTSSLRYSYLRSQERRYKRMVGLQNMDPGK